MNKKKKKRKHINSKRNECSSLVIWFGWWFWVHFQRFTERWCLQLKMKREQEVFGCHNISHGKVYYHFSVNNHSNIPFLWILTCQRQIKQSSTKVDTSNTEAPFIKEAKTRHHAFSRCKKLVLTFSSADCRTQLSQYLKCSSEFTVLMYSAGGSVNLPWSASYLKQANN